MALFQMKWLRNFVRRHTSPVPFGVAEVWKQRLSIAYALIAWNAFGFVLYQCFSGNADWAKTAGLKTEDELQISPAVAFSKQFKIEKAKVIRLSGLDYHEYEIDNKNGTDNDAIEGTGE